MKKTMKRSLAVILAMLMLMSAVPFTSFAYSRECPNCHEITNFELIPSVPATCADGNEDGTRCSECGYTEGGAVISGTGNHDFENWKAGKAATCTQDGKMGSKKCKMCKKFFDNDGNKIADTEAGLVIPKAHSFGGWTVNTAPSCTTDGEKTHTCSACDFTETETIEATGHTAVTDAAVAPDCTTAGKTAGSHCSVCDTVIVAQTDVDKLEHTFGEMHAEVPATCTEPGTKAYQYCSVCEKNYDADEVEIADISIPATGHDDPAGVEWSYPAGFDCTVGGKQVKLCHCGEQLAEAEEAVPPTTHINVNIPSNPATCSTEGNTVGMKCSVCGIVGFETNPIPAKGHVIGDTLEKVEAVEAECTKDGNKEHYRCNDCEGYFVVDENEAITKVQEEDVVIAALNHQHESVAKVPATCKGDGKEEGVVCARCGETLSGCAKIPALEHAVATNLELQAAVPAKCDATGKEEHYRCKDCGFLFVEKDEEFVVKTEEELTTDALGHVEGVTLTKTEKKDETCTEDGNEEYYTCKDCEKLFEKAEDGTYSEITQADTVIAKGHKFEKVVAESSDATCTEGGKLVEKCSRCDAEDSTRETMLDKLGHDFSEEWEEIESTCTQEGSKWHKCLREGCQEKAEETIIPKKDHAYDIIEIPVECTQDGKRTYDCMVCHDHKEEILKADGRHTDIDSNGICDVCHQQSCDCMCHKDNFFYKLIYWICKIWWQYLGINETCACGAVHYSKSVF